MPKATKKTVLWIRISLQTIKARISKTSQCPLSFSNKITEAVWDKLSIDSTSRTSTLLKTINKLRIILIKLKKRSYSRPSSRELGVWAALVCIIKQIIRFLIITRFQRTRSCSLSMITPKSPIQSPLASISVAAVPIKYKKATAAKALAQNKHCHPSRKNSTKNLSPHPKKPRKRHI